MEKVSTPPLAGIHIKEPHIETAPVDPLPKHPIQDELPIAEHGIIGNMLSSFHAQNFVLAKI
jgi:hypothetical protein